MIEACASPALISSSRAAHVTDLLYAHPRGQLGQRGRARPRPRSPRGPRRTVRAAAGHAKGTQPPRSSRIRAPRLAARQHSARATARPPSAMSWALARLPAATAARTAAMACARRPGRTRAAAGAARRRRVWPVRIRAGRERRARPARCGRPRAAKPRPAADAGIGHAPDHAHHRCGVDRPLGALVVERHVAAYHRHVRGRGRRRPGRGPTRSAARRCAASRGCRSSGSWSAPGARRPRRRGWPRTRAPPRACPR